MTTVQLLRGDRMIATARASGHITALTDGEIASVLGLLLRGAAMAGWLGVSTFNESLAGNAHWWALLAFAVSVPQIVGWVAAWLGWKPHHEGRIALLVATAGMHAMIATIWIGRDVWVQAGLEVLLLFLAVRAVSRVWHYNGPNRPLWR